MQNLEIQIPVFKCSASNVGKIMTNPKGKSVRQRLDELISTSGAKLQTMAFDLQDRREKYKDMKPNLKTTEKAAEMIDKKEAAYREYAERSAAEISDLRARVDEPNLSQTCISYLRKWVDEKIYQRRVEFTSKMTDKGNLVEDDAINYASIHLGWGLVSKNLDRYHNDYIHGEPDVVMENEVPDIKSSYTHETFPLYSPELENEDYAWQDLSYMWLCEKPKGSIVYVLMSMPEEMIRKEARWKLPEGYTEEEYAEFAKQFQYDDLPPYLRIKQYDVPRDGEKIEAIKTRVLECRAYIETVILPEVEKNFRKYQSIKA